MAVGQASRETIFDTVEIQEVLPHRYPFLLVDRIVEFVEGERIVGLKAVTMNEPFFQGHFPGAPVMPGVLIMEAMAQTGAVLAKKSADGIAADKLIYLVGADEFKWKRQVVPGDTLLIEMKVLKFKRPLWKLSGTVTVDGQLVASGVVSAAEAR